MLMFIIIGLISGVIVLILGLILYDYINEVISIFISVIGGMFVITFLVLILCYLSSIPKIKFINKTYNTKYTVEEYMFNESLIRESIIGKKHNLKIEESK